MKKVKIVLLCMIMCTVLFACGRNTEEYFSSEKETLATETKEAEAKKADTEEATEPEDSSEAASDNDSKRTVICIYICGCVKEPGVYEFSKEARVCEAIERAGGFTEKADINFWNQAMTMEDGMMIYVPSEDENLSMEEATGGGTSDGQSQAEGLININRADKATLITIPGIGEARAESIISYRQENGDFASIEDITRVSGIGNSLFEKIREYITVH